MNRAREHKSHERNKATLGQKITPLFENKCQQLLKTIQHETLAKISTKKTRLCAIRAWKYLHLFAISTKHGRKRYTGYRFYHDTRTPEINMNIVSSLDAIEEQVYYVRPGCLLPNTRRVKAHEPGNCIKCCQSYAAPVSNTDSHYA